MATCGASRECCQLFLRNRTWCSQAASLWAQSRHLQSWLVYTGALSLPLRYCSRHQSSRCTGSTFLCTVIPAWVLLPMPRSVWLLPTWLHSHGYNGLEELLDPLHQYPRHSPPSHLTAGGAKALLCGLHRRLCPKLSLSEASGSSLPPIFQPRKTKFKIRITPPWGLQ